MLNVLFVVVVIVVVVVVVVVASIYLETCVFVYTMISSILTRGSMWCFQNVIVIAVAMTVVVVIYFDVIVAAIVAVAI